MDISIIVPVFNTEPSLLRRCFDSIRLKRDVTFEVIVVDDGSKPETADFCRKYADENPNFRYYRQENKGVSVARNAGVDQATGEYVLFVDSDDELLPEAICKEQLQQKYDIIFYDAELVESSYVRRIKPFPEEAEGVLLNKDAVTAALVGRINPPWAKCFRRAFLQEKQIGFEPSMLWAEDAYFVMTAVFHVQSVYYAPKMVYRYHHVLTTDSNRIRKFPYETVENVIRLYHYGKSHLQTNWQALELAVTEQENLQVHIAQMLIKRLFNIVGIQGIYKIDCNPARELVLKTAKEVHAELAGKLTVSYKVRCNLLKNNRRALILLAARLRSVYMRMRK